MDDIIVTKLDGRWAVTREGIILTQQPTTPEAIKIAVDAAAEAALAGERARVLLDDRIAPCSVLWDSSDEGSDDTG
jgi:hypothetical protein